MKRYVIIIIAVILLIAIKFFYFSPQEEQVQGSKPGMGAPVYVTAIVASSESLERKIFVTGTVLPNEEVALVPESSGKIVQLNFKEVSVVQKGDLLVKINDADLQAQLKKQKAQLQLAKDKEQRQKKLLEINGISKEEYETSLNVYESIEADIEFTNAQIAKTEIRAPFSGIIGLRKVSEGSYVTPVSKIATIQQIDPVKIDFSVPEKYASLIQHESSIRFSIEENQSSFDAKVIAVEPMVDINTRTVNVRAICSNKENKLFPGSFATIEIILKETENNILIPTEALIPVLKGYKVFISKDGKAQEARVVAGIRTRNRVQITQGLQNGDTVITSGLMQVKPGSAVKVIRNTLKE